MNSLCRVMHLFLLANRVILCALVLHLNRCQLLLLDDLSDQGKVFQEVVLRPILGENFKYTHNTVVSLINQVMESGCINEGDHSVHCILSQDYMLMVNYLLKLAVGAGALNLCLFFFIVSACL